MSLAIKIIMGILLFAAAIADLRSKKISRALIAALAFAGLAGIFAKDNFSVWQTAGGVSIGMCAVGLSVASKEQIGRGDGLVIAALGLALGFGKCLSVVCIASVIMAFASVIILILRKGNKDTRLPFVPALFASYVLCMAVGL
ncbi:MAG: prepilin peptidase [Lachnospiraceae bacterium]|nr:prepilin peptidase [Lachnospiraceae bacterium]